MQPVSLAFFWHQHQPYYPDDVGGENPMPWVRLHGTKDYYGMALHIQEVPEFRCTINLVPSLLLQIQGYTDHGASDQHLDISRMPADGLSKADGVYLLNHFFMASADNMIRPYPRYAELLMKRGLGKDSAKKALPRFSERDIRDLQVWSNLTWMHPLAFEIDSDLRDFRDKGQYWSEDEKAWLLDKQMEILRRIIPLHRELSQGGQVELTTTPFYHPILPLLHDKRLAREAMPGCNLPRHTGGYHDDLQVQLRRAVDYHEEVFGIAPQGLWPSEGSVAQDIIPAIAEVGIEWIATDEEILCESTSGWVSRDHQGHMRHPEMLFRPWRIGEGDNQLQIVFRDHAMSDLIGFHYQRDDPMKAVDDLLGRIHGISRAVDGRTGGRPPLVPIILDGENCWEYYHDGGVKFLRTLYQECVSRDFIRPVRMIDHLHEYPAADRIARLYAGSWISHNFAIWIGHEEDVAAWDLLHDTRQFLKRAEADGQGSPEALKRAWEEIYIAEGSDWFWWFGDDHSSDQDAMFDRLFRKHLQNVYTLLGETPPNSLNQPIGRSEQRAIHTAPTGFLSVKVDGRRTFFEWISAAHYTSGSERGTMTLVTAGLVREVYFGFDADRLFLRIDTSKVASEDLAAVGEVRVKFTLPVDVEIRITGFEHRAPSAKLFIDNVEVADSRVEVAVGHILELAVPFADLKVKPGDAMQMSVEAYTDNQSIDRAPREGNLDLTVPSADFEMIMWQV